MIEAINSQKTNKLPALYSGKAKFERLTALACTALSMVAAAQVALLANSPLADARVKSLGRYENPSPQFSQASVAQYSETNLGK